MESDDLKRRRAAALAAATAKAARTRASEAAAKPSQRGEGGFTDFMGFVNRGLVDTALGLGDLVTYPVRAGYRSITGDVMESPSNTIADIMRGLGVAVAEPGQEAETTGQRIGEFVGGAAGGLGALGGLASAARNVGGPVVSGAASSLLQPYLARPTLSTAQELTAATGAAIGGRALAEADAEFGRAVGESLLRSIPGMTTMDAPGVEAAGRAGATVVEAAQEYAPGLLQMVGELAGGAAGATAGPAAVGAARGGLSASTSAPLGLGVTSKIIQHAIDPLEGQRRLARDALGNLIEAPADEVVRRIDEDSILSLTPAQRSQEPRLVKAEQDILKGNASLDAEYKAQRARVFQEAASEIMTLGEGGSAQSAAQRLGEWVDTSRNMLETSVAEALDTARADILRAGSEIADQTDLSVMFANRLDQTYDRVKLEETNLWNQVPRNVVGETANAQAALSTIQARAGVTLADDLPERATRFLDPKSDDFLGDFTSATELQNLYSHFRRIQREATAAGSVGGNAQTAAYAREMAEGIKADLDAIAAISPQLDAARAYTRNLHEVFDAGDIGAVLGTKRDGTPRVQPEVALRRLLGQTGSGLVAQRNLIEEAVGPYTPTGVPDPQARTLADTYIGRRFQDAVMPDVDGDVSARAAAGFVARNQDFLRRFPELGDRIFTAAQSTRTAAAAQTDAKSQLDALAVSPAARFAGAKEYGEFAAMLTGQSPRQDVAQLRKVAEEIGPEAVEGVRASAADYFLKMMREQDDSTGLLGLTAKGVLDPKKRGLNDPATMDAMSELFEPEQLARLQQVTAELSRVDASTAARRGGTTNLLGTTAAEDTMMTLIARTVGLFGFKAFTPPGMGTVQGPTVGANFAQHIKNVMTTGSAEDMVRRAVLQRTPQDAELFRILLQPVVPGERATASMQRALDAWLRSAGYTQGLDSEDPLEEFRRGLGLPEVNLPSSSYDPTDPFWAR
jgi:hypothetical protein